MQFYEIDKHSKDSKDILSYYAAFCGFYNNAQINTYSDCIKGISYYIQIDENHDATVTIDMNEAHSNVYLSNMVLLFLSG